MHSTTTPVSSLATPLTTWPYITAPSPRAAAIASGRRELPPSISKSLSGLGCTAVCWLNCSRCISYSAEVIAKESVWTQTPVRSIVAWLWPRERR